MRIGQIVAPSVTHVVFCLIQFKIKIDFSIVGKKKRVVTHNAVVRSRNRIRLFEFAQQGPSVFVARARVQVVQVQLETSEETVNLR